MFHPSTAYGFLNTLGFLEPVSIAWCDLNYPSSVRIDKNSILIRNSDLEYNLFREERWYIKMICFILWFLDTGMKIWGLPVFLFCRHSIYRSFYSKLFLLTWADLSLNIFVRQIGLITHIAAWQSLFSLTCQPGIDTLCLILKTGPVASWTLSCLWVAETLGSVTLLWGAWICLFICFIRPFNGWTPNWKSHFPATARICLLGIIPMGLAREYLKHGWDTTFRVLFSSSFLSKI